MSGDVDEVTGLLERWLDDDDVAPLSIRTSGSTGEPKDVLLSRAAIAASARATLARLGGPGSWVLALPATYVAGLQVVVRALLGNGTCRSLAPGEGALGQAVGALPPGRRYAALVPTQLHRLLADEDETAALASLDAVLLGGSAARPGLVAAARERGITVLTTYGMTETCGGCVYDGVPLDGVRVRLDDDGRVLLAGAVLFDGYDGAQPASASEVRDGWLVTPDLGRWSADGRLEVLGRIDDVAISGGVNVSLAAVERALAEHPAVADVAVVAVPDDEWGERVVAVVVPRADDGPTLDGLRDLASASVPRAWAPRSLRLVAALPMLASGKPDRQALRDACLVEQARS